MTMNRSGYLTTVALSLAVLLVVLVELSAARKVVVKKVKKTVKRIPLGEGAAGDGALLGDSFSKSFDLTEVHSNRSESHHENHHEHHSQDAASRTRDSGGQWRKGENGEMIYERTVITESSRHKSHQQQGGKDNKKNGKSDKSSSAMMEEYTNEEYESEDSSSDKKKKKKKHGKKYDENERKLKRNGGFIFNMDEETTETEVNGKSHQKQGGKNNKKNGKSNKGSSAMMEEYTNEEYESEDSSTDKKKKKKKHGKKYDENERKLKRNGGFIFNMDEETTETEVNGKSKKRKGANGKNRRRRVKSRNGKSGPRYGYMMDVETTVDMMHRWEEVDSLNFCSGKGWNEFDGYCYKIIAHAMNNADAHKACEEEDSHLASIHSSLENDFVTMLTAQVDYASLRNPDKGVWIGMTRKPTSIGTFGTEWHDKTTPTFGLQEQNHPAPNKFPWRVGQPDNAHGNEWCVHLYPFYHNDGHSHHGFMSQWNDFNCDEIMDMSVCKKPSQCGFVNGADDDDYSEENEQSEEDSS